MKMKGPGKVPTGMKGKPSAHAKPVSGKGHMMRGKMKGEPHRGSGMHSPVHTALDAADSGKHRR